MSRQIGLRDIYVAVITKNDATTYTTETPVKLERAIKAKISPKTDSEDLFSDDELEETVSTLSSVDIEIELNQLSLASRALLQGASVVKGVLKETKDDVAPYVAFGFKSKKANGKFRFVWLYKGKFELTEDEFETTAEKVKAQTNSLKGTFGPRVKDGSWRAIGDEDEAGWVAATGTSWFNAVQEQPAAA